MARNTKSKGQVGYKTAHKMEKTIDDLIEFENFCEEILPALRKDMKAGLSAQDMYNKYQAMAAARSISIVAREVDSGKALSAIKDILDRTQGKAVERHDHRHHLADIPEEQLDALLLSELAEVEITSASKGMKH